MSRLTQIVLHGKSYQMPASFQALAEVTERVCDPLKTLVAASRQGKIVDLPLSQAQCVTLLCIGVRQAGCNDPQDEIEEAVFQLGPEQYLPLAIIYLSNLCSGEGSAKRAPKGAAPKPPRGR